MVKWYATSSDVDDLKQASSRSGLGTDGFAHVLEYLNDPFVSLDEREAIAYVNSAGETLFGRSRGELMKKPVFSIFPDQVAPLLREGLAQALRQGREVSIDIKLKQPTLKEYRMHILPNEGAAGLLLRTKPESIDAPGRRGGGPPR